MRRIILICGIISGIIVSTFMVASTAACYVKKDFEGNMLLGYAAMLLSFSLIFVGIKNYRDKYADGTVSFGRAFMLGLYMTLIASTIYVVAWAIDYYLFIPDFMERYAEHVLAQTQREGASAAEMQQTVEQMDGYKKMYENPLLVVLLTYAEILPIGLIVSLISALILKRTGNQARVA